MTPSIAANVRPYALIRLGRRLADLGRRPEAIATLTEAIDLLETLQLTNFRQAEAIWRRSPACSPRRAAPTRAARPMLVAARVYEATGDAGRGAAATPWRPPAADPVIGRVLPAIACILLRAVLPGLVGFAAP